MEVLINIENNSSILLTDVCINDKINDENNDVTLKSQNNLILSLNLNKKTNDLNLTKILIKNKEYWYVLNEFNIISSTYKDDGYYLFYEYIYDNKIIIREPK